MPGVRGTMEEFKAGTLKSSSGDKVTNPKQAIAIGLSEERRMGKKSKGKSKGKSFDKSTAPSHDGPEAMPPSMHGAVKDSPHRDVEAQQHGFSSSHPRMHGGTRGKND